MSTPANDPTIIEAVVDRPAHGGESIALLDGRVILVRGAIPGERIRIALDDADAKLWRGEAVEILDPSPHRIEPRCAAAAAGAGCCDLGHVDPAHAPELKRDVLLDALRRIGRFDVADLPEPSVTALSPATGWRTRVRLGVDEEGRAGLRKRKSRDVVAGAGARKTFPADDGSRRGRRRARRGELHVVRDADGDRRAARDRQGPQAPGHPGGGFADAVGASATRIQRARRRLLAVLRRRRTLRRPIGELPAAGGRAWDLYGGVVFATALADRRADGRSRPWNPSPRPPRSAEGAGQFAVGSAPHG